jgi:hypothetical protein
MSDIHIPAVIFIQTQAPFIVMAWTESEDV